jgi:small subunit ribosomal protein S16
MLVIRYFRIGKKNQPYFKIVVTDQRMPIRGGRFVEEVGFADPVKKKRTLKADRIKYWISKGAQPSDSIYNLLVSEKIIEGKKRDVHKKKKLTEEEKKAAAAPVVPTAKLAETSAPAEAKKEELKVEVKPEAPKAPAAASSSAKATEDKESSGVAKEEPKPVA